ncbi:MAG: response regulator transcription factor [Spirochaetia bacterium]|jgi:two-component system OmpR family response regulator|nr:response regulator transcription factor [Spirochaetia bacterium]
MKILIIEDDKDIISFVSKGLHEAGYVVDSATDGDEGYMKLLTSHYDAAVVDIMLPGIDGLTVIENIRSKKIYTPIIILSAKREVDDRVIGFQKGGDDYLTKPFSFSELLVRIQALIRRSSNIKEKTLLECNDLSMNLISHTVKRENVSIELQPKEFALLEYLLRNKERVLSKTLIMENIWDYNFDPQTNIVDVVVSRLRSKIDKDFSQKLLHTVRGVGYVLKEN